MSLALCEGNSPVTLEFPSQRSVTRSLIFSFISTWINGWVNNRDAGDLRRHRTHYDLIVMIQRAIACWYNHKLNDGLANNPKPKISRRSVNFIRLHSRFIRGKAAEGNLLSRITNIRCQYLFWNQYIIYIYYPYRHFRNFHLDVHSKLICCCIVLVLWRTLPWINDTGSTVMSQWLLRYGWGLYCDNGLPR